MWDGDGEELQPEASGGLATWSARPAQQETAVEELLAAPLAKMFGSPEAWATRWPLSLSRRKKAHPGAVPRSV